MAEQPAREAPTGKILPNVKNTIAVASGKGGVGKSTTSLHLALALQEAAGKPVRVGILDADIYGPSMAVMFGLEGQRPQVNERGKLVPFEKFGIKVVSMAFLSDPDKPVIWRGPMVDKVLKQFLQDVDWGELDYLVIDLPPGTGDAQLSISQILDISGAVIVTTPQKVSIIDARKGLLMFRQLKVPVLGIVENMSYMACPHCDERIEIFRNGGGREAAEQLSVPFLGEIPLDPRVVIGGDEGEPISQSHPDSPVTAAFSELATQVIDKLGDARGEDKPTNTPIMPGRMDWK